MGFDLLGIIIVLIIIIISMTIHEAMHGYVSYWLGDDTAVNEGRLTFNPIKHLDPFLSVIMPLILAISGGPIFGGAKPMPFNPNNVRWGEWGAAIIAIAGPLTNFTIAFITFGLMTIMNLQSSAIGSVLMLVVNINLGFFIFNMLPIPPLDGSRLIYAIAPDFVRRGMEIIENYGIILVLVIVLIASGPLLNFMQIATGGILDLFQAIFSL